ncbi:translation initiation factor 2 [Candidatus Pacearchaeota archaeon]|nr:translation initiation factor 2 [Candidatus Pacearchaeota archaeon]
MRTIGIVGLVVVCLMSVGCATVIRGVTQDIRIDSTPAGAQVMVDGVFCGVTPVVVEMARGCDHTVQIGGSYYLAKTVFVQRNFSGAIAGNALLGGWLGAGVDALSGASYDLTPSSICVPLQRKGQVAVLKE